ncbi:MAG: recombinase family protein [Candidatus Bathyarchaeia archaeon]
MSLKAVAYVRVSTREQDEWVQRHAIEKFCHERGIDILEWYVDKGESGAKPFAERPSAQRLLSELSATKPDLIVAWSLDRLGRTMLDTMNMVLALEESGFRVVTVREEWMQALDEGVRRLILSILSWVAEFERKRIRERQLEAWEAGKQKGRPKKVQDEVIRKYMNRYRGLSIRAVWKIMRGDGLDISYDHLRRRLKQMGFRVRLTGR